MLAVVGVSRAITDFAFCTYLSDLAVDAAYQRQGIGKRLDHPDSTGPLDGLDDATDEGVELA